MEQTDPDSEVPQNFVLGSEEETRIINVSSSDGNAFNILEMPIIFASNDACDVESFESEGIELIRELDITTKQSLSVTVQDGSDQVNENTENVIGSHIPSTSSANDAEQLNSNEQFHTREETEPRIQSVKTRKKSRRVSEWKRNVRKIKHQSGEQYSNSRGKIVRKKEINNRKDCVAACKYQCGNISENIRKKQFKAYYSLDQNGKYHFLLKTTEKLVKIRSTTSNETSRRNFTFKYYFYVGDEKIQVCKSFYLGTLSISQKPVYNVHAKKDICTGIPLTDMRGKYKNRYSISNDSKQSVRDHIQSFPIIESHYCRSRTSKRYLEPHLSIEKMYQLYLEKCTAENTNHVKSSMYRNIFCTEFHLDFHKPKSDRCAKCETFIISKRENLSKENDEVEYNLHVLEKNKMREEKKRDKENKETPILCFDLQNVITCPRSEISPMFYYKKLNIYNLTAYLSTTKKVYCALWTEFTSGRSGNDLASAFIKILERVTDDNQITDLVTWSDSCVPQNRNSFMSYAVLNFLGRNPDINSITMKYSVPGHSAIQEVDSAHSVIEKALSKTEFYSPLGLVRILKAINRTNPYCIIQMKPEDFKDYAGGCTNLSFKTVPFASVAMLKFIRDHCYEIYYKKSYAECDFATACIKGRASVISFPIPQTIMLQNEIRNDKREHFIKMMRFMTIQDRNFYQALLKLTDDELKRVSKSEDLENYNRELMDQNDADKNEQNRSGPSSSGTRKRPKPVKKFASGKKK